MLTFVNRLSSLLGIGRNCVTVFMPGTAAYGLFGMTELACRCLARSISGSPMWQLSAIPKLCARLRDSRPRGQAPSPRTRIVGVSYCNVSEAGGIIDGESWRTPAAWRVVMRRRCCSDHVPVESLMDLLEGGATVDQFLETVSGRSRGNRCSRFWTLLTARSWILESRSFGRSPPYGVKYWESLESNPLAEKVKSNMLWPHARTIFRKACQG